MNLHGYSVTIYVDGMVKGMKSRTRGEGAEVINGEVRRYQVLTCLYANDSVLFAESEQILQMVCDGRKLNVKC